MQTRVSCLLKRSFAALAVFASLLPAVAPAHAQSLSNKDLSRRLGSLVPVPADLVLDSFHFRYLDGGIGGFAPGPHLFLIVKNRGGVAAPASRTRVQITQQVTDVDISVRFLDLATPPLASGASATLDIPSASFTARYKVIVDTDEIIAEASEKNNETSLGPAL